MAPDAMSYPLPPHGGDSALTASPGVHYPIGDQMGETGFQQFIIHGLVFPLRDYFANYFANKGRNVLVGADQFFYYRQGNPRCVVAPDVYLVDDETIAPRDVDCWKVWDHGGKAPALALEIVSRRNHRKDYAPRMLERYTELGVHELVRYDPDHRGRKGRQFLTHWVRDAAGALVLRPSPPDRVQSAYFGFWLVSRADEALELCTGPLGADRWQTAAERAQATADRALEENVRLRAELARLRGG